jgi:hypothetical protein
MSEEEKKAIKRLKYKEYCLRISPYQKKKKSEQSLAYYYRNAEKISIKRKEARKQNKSHDR